MLAGRRLRRRQRSEHSNGEKDRREGRAGCSALPWAPTAYPPRPQANARLLFELVFDTWTSTVSPAATV